MIMMLTTGTVMTAGMNMVEIRLSYCCFRCEWSCFFSDYGDNNDDGDTEVDDVDDEQLT